MISNEILRVIGWTIIHSAWQFLVLYAALRLVFLLLNKNNANARYLAGIMMITACVIVSVVTFCYEYRLYFTHTLYQAINVAAVNKPLILLTAHSGSLTKVTAIPGHNILFYLDLISPYLSFAWIAGILFYSIKMLNGGYQISRLSKLLPSIYPEINEKLAALCEKMKIGRYVRLIINEAITEPLTFGHFKPIILLPCSYVTRVPADQLEMILAHELAHIKRYDYLVNLVQTVLEAVFFFNPFFKLISLSVKNEREFCCDDMALRYCGDNRTMAIALASLKLSGGYPGFSLAAAPAKSVFRSRIGRLIEPAGVETSSLRNLVLILLAFAFSMALIGKFVNMRRASKTLSAAVVLVPKHSAAIAPLITPQALVNTEQQGATVQASPPNGPLLKIVAAVADTDTTRGTAKPVNSMIDGFSPKAILYTPDTVEYAVRGYKNKLPPNATLSTLLAQIDAFKITPDGKIFHMGKEIKTFKVGGQPWTGPGIIQDFPVDKIHTIQICFSSQNDEPTLNISRILFSATFGNAGNRIHTTDTVEYAARSYLKLIPENSALPTLLSKMEGFKVDPDGKIFHLGMEVKRFKMDGQLMQPDAIKTVPAGIAYIIQISYAADPLHGDMNIITKKTN